MSVDLRDELRAAAEQPQHPIDVESVYRRGVRGRLGRIAAATGGGVALAVAFGLALSTVLPSNDVPLIVDPLGQDDALADGRVSWREYRTAVAATSDCLAENDDDPTYRFDDTTAEFVFVGAGPDRLAECTQEHLDEVASHWQHQVGQASTGISWTDYRASVDRLDECLSTAAVDATLTLNLAEGRFDPTWLVPTGSGSAVAETAAELCQTSTGFQDAQKRWTDQVGPSQEEEQRLYDLAVECMRDSGIEVADSRPDTLSDVSHEHPDRWDACLTAARRAFRPYLGTDVPTTTLAERLAEARDHWESSHPDDYVYTSTWSCDCLLDGDLRVTVDDGAVATVRYVDGRDGPPVGAAMTVPDMLESLDRALAHGTVESATFHPGLGYPISFMVVRDVADPSSRLELTNLEMEGA